VTHTKILRNSCSKQWQSYTYDLHTYLYLLILYIYRHLFYFIDLVKLSPVWCYQLWWNKDCHKCRRPLTFNLYTETASEQPCSQLGLQVAMA